MRGQLGLSALLPRQTARRRAGNQGAAATEAAAARANAADNEATPRARVVAASERAHARGRDGAGTGAASDAESASARVIAPRAGLGFGISAVASPRASAASRAHAIGRPRTNPSASTPRTAALRYAAWNWPITPNPDQAPSTDLEQVFATWSRMPEAPILAACGLAFDVIEADAVSGRTALIRLDRLGVQLGPVLVTRGCGARTSGARINFLVRVGTAAALSPLMDPHTGPALLGSGAHVELPKALEQAQSQAHFQLHLAQRAATAPVSPDAFWLRAPSVARPALPAAHVVLGALALAPRRSLAGSLPAR